MDTKKYIEPKYWDTMNLFDYMDYLTESFCKTLESFMCKVGGYYWNENKIWIELYELLGAMMYYEESKNLWLSK